MTPRLSLICPALLCRRRKSFTSIDDVREQIQGQPAELIVLEDDAGLSIGEKMNHLYRMARGEYVCAFADDDLVREDYVATLLEAIGETDVVTFNVDWQAGRAPLAGERSEEVYCDEPGPSTVKTARLRAAG